MNKDKIQIYFKTSEISCAATFAITVANCVPACKIHLYSCLAVTMYLPLSGYQMAIQRWVHHKQYSNINIDQGIHKIKYLCPCVCVCADISTSMPSNYPSTTPHLQIWIHHYFHHSVSTIKYRRTIEQSKPII
jgi:hypothetical protein